jgi:hypothetical protein
VTATYSGVTLDVGQPDIRLSVDGVPEPFERTFNKSKGKVV